MYLKHYHSRYKTYLKIITRRTERTPGLLVCCLLFSVSPHHEPHWTTTGSVNLKFVRTDRNVFKTVDRSSDRVFLVQISLSGSLLSYNGGTRRKRIKCDTHSLKLTDSDCRHLRPSSSKHEFTFPHRTRLRFAITATKITARGLCTYVLYMYMHMRAYE